MSFKLDGADQLLTKLRKGAKYEDVKNAVKLNGTELQRKMKRNASFTQGYQTGTTKRSINLEVDGRGLTATVAPTTDYSPYLVYGTRFMTSQDFFYSRIQLTETYIHKGFNEIDGVNCGIIDS